MAMSRGKSSDEHRTRRRPATTPEGRENQLIAMAVDLTERQLQDGTASAQVITHYLKLGSSREKLEQERLAMELELSKAKIEQMESVKKVEQMYAEAMEAFRGYSGQSGPTIPGDDEDQDFL